jgi:Uma2 family endonuclease
MSVLLSEVPTGEPGRYRLSVREYDRMAKAGVFHPDARIELINGEIVTMTPIGDGHDYVVTRLEQLLHRHLDGRAVVRTQGPLLCGEWSEPEPDLAVVRGPLERYQGRPTASDALLVVEVANSSLQRDQHDKVPLYGRLEVPEVWVVDLPHGRVRVYTEPKDDGYATRAVLTPSDTLVPTAFPDVEIPVDVLRLDHPWAS